MSQNKPKVILTRKLPETVETRMRELFNATLNDSDEALTRSELEAAVKTADVLVPTVTDKIDSDLIGEAGDQLRLIASFGTGVDHIDLAAAKARGITVTNTPGVLTEDTADVTMALILAVPRRIAEVMRWPGRVCGKAGHQPVCWAIVLMASALALLAWAVSARRLLGVPEGLGYQFIIIIASQFTPKLRLSLKQLIGSHSIKCWPGLISCR